MQTHLFGDQPVQNLLPEDGTVVYEDHLFTEAESSYFLETLVRTLPWQPDEVVMYGKRITTRRKVAWYGDRPFAYTYSHTTRVALPWTPELQKIKERIENHSGLRFNSCLLNLYHEGSEGMGWHSDDEPTLVPDAPIASVSFGATRKFAFRHKKTKETRSVFLQNGSLLMMKDQTQRFWHHALLKTTRKTGMRINLTFRCMKD